MAVAFDAASSSGATGVVSLPHTCTGADRLLLLFMADWTGSDVSARTVNPQYNGVAMTLHATHAFNTGRIEVWYLIAPATGTHNITYTLGGTEAVVGISLTGVHQTTPLPTVSGNTGNSTTPTSAAITIPTGDLWVDALGILCGTGATANASFTPRASVAPCNPKCQVATRDGTGASFTHTWTGYTQDAPQRWAGLALRVQQVAVVVVVTPPPSVAVEGQYAAQVDLEGEYREQQELTGYYATSGFPEGGDPVARTGQNIDLYSGDDLDLVVTVYDADDAIKNLTGASATYAVKDRPGGADLFTPKQTTPGTGIVITTPLAGILTVSIQSADTDGLPGNRNYYHELEIVIGTKRCTAFTGRLKLFKSVAGVT